MSLRLRLALWYGGTAALTVAIAAVIVWIRFSGDLRSTLDEALAVQVADTTAALAADGGGAVLREDPARPGIFTMIVAGDGAVLARSPTAPAQAAPVTAGASTWRRPGLPALALYARQAKDGRTVVAGTSLDRMHSEIARLAVLLAATAAFASIVSMGGGWLLAGRALAPVRLLADEADRIHADLVTRGRRLQIVERRDELGRLATTMNRMLDRVEEGIEQQQLFVAAASHDLRTPIAALRVELELALRSDVGEPDLRMSIGEALSDVVRLGRLADGLLALAAVQHDEAIRVTSMSVAEAVAGVVDQAAGAATGPAVTFEIDVVGATVLAPEVQLERTLANLVDNAVRHSPTGGAVTIRARLTGPVAQVPVIGHDAAPSVAPADLRPAAPCVLEVDVMDRGPGVPAHQLPRLFAAFSHPPGADGGAGLGLATAAAAVRAAGGSIGYRDRPGGGAWFWFRMPARVIARVAEPAGAAGTGPVPRGVTQPL